MDKILVSVYLLGLEETYDVFLPINVKVRDAIGLIQNSIKEMSNGNYEVSDNFLLYNCEDGGLINLNNIVKYSGIKNGGKVILTASN